MSVLDAPHFRDDTEARKLLERLRWPDGLVCAHCGSAGRSYANKSKPGVYRCAEPECRKDFTVTTNTAMGSSHIPLHKWMIGFYLMNSSKKGVSAKQLERTLLITYRSAWFMAHRIREAMTAGGIGLLGSGGGIVEADETFIGRKKGFVPKGGGFGHKMKVMSLVERGGEVRSVVMDKVSRKSVEAIIRTNVSHEAHLRTDTAQYYVKKGFGTASHELVNHYSGEYVRGDAHTNTLEGFYSIFKRGMKGIYQHCGEQHLHRYMHEFDFRYNHREKLGFTDVQRTMAALKGIEGKRLTYRQPRTPVTSF